MSTGKESDNSNFSRRCIYLSRYLKEKGSFGDIDIDLARKSDLDFAGKSNLRGQQNAIKKAGACGSGTKPFELIQKLSIGEASISVCKTRDAHRSEPAKVTLEPVNSQLTIFFGGKVIVYNEFPKDKANEIMKAAREANPVAVDSKNNQNHINLGMNISNKSNVEIPDLNEPTSSESNKNHQTKQQQQQHVVERIARRASLHRFFAKRKDRAVARAPYQVNQNGGYLPPKPEMVSPSVQSGQPSRQLATTLKPKGHNDMSLEVEGGGKCSKHLELKL